MYKPLNTARRGLFFAIIGLLCLSYISPVASLAASLQTSGDETFISSGDGGAVNLRETVGFEGPVLTSVPDQTPITIIDGPVTAEDGSSWYLVSVWGTTGYIGSDMVAFGSSETETPDEMPVETETSDAEDMPADESVADEPVNEVIPWQDPIDYGVVVNNTQDGSFPESGIACRTAASEDASESYRYQLGDTVEITGEEFWEGDFAWYPVNCAGAGGFAKSLYISVAALEETEEVVTEEVTEEVATEEATEEVATEEATEEVATEEVTEEVATEEVTEEVVTEEATEEVATEEATEEVATEEVTEEVATEEVTEEVVTEEVTEEVATEEVSEEVATEEATEEVVTEEATGEVATEEVPIDAPVIGSAEVQGTNGDGLACRVNPSADATVLTVLAEGTEVQVTSQTDPAWLQIICGNQLGFAKTEFLWSGGAGDDELVAAATGSATVANTGGMGVRCRTGGGLNATIITTLGEGSTVSTRGASSGGWTPVVCQGTNGFVSSEYLSGGGSSSTPGGSTGSTGSTRVAGTGGDGVRCRTGAGTSSTVITVLSEGASVSTRGASANGWTPVTCGGMSGFISSQYLSGGGGGGTTSPTPTPNPGSGTTTGSAKVSGTNGDGVRCRTSGSTSSTVITLLPEGTSVGTRGASSNGWTPVSCGGQNGFVSSEYLTAGGGGTTSPTPTPAPGNPGTGSGLGANDKGKVTSTLNLRYNPSMTAGIATTAPTGTVVKIVSGPQSGFYKVDWDGLGGYMHGDYLVKTNDALSERGGSATPAPEPPTNPGNGTGTGNAMADFALGYVGYPYVWNTRGPSSFDCSGFTYWVTKNVIGADIGSGLWTQAAAGTPVSKGNLQAGDIVFFQNTYKSGLSHVGIYIGGGQFVHAENQNTGVRISDLNSSYYGSRWYGAVRLG